MQFQADLLGTLVEVAADTEATALGAAALAGLGVGLWRTPGEEGALIRRGAVYEPRLRRADVERQREGWRQALARALA